jgi:von Willebrand factor type A domain
MTTRLRTIAPALLLIASLAATATAFSEPPARAAPLTAHQSPAWPPTWPETTPPLDREAPPRFEPPSAADCQREPTTVEVPGLYGAPNHNGSTPGDTEFDAAKAGAPRRSAPEPATAAAAKPRVSIAGAAASTLLREGTVTDRFTTTTPPAAPAPAPQAYGSHGGVQRDRSVTAGVVDDNADFGEYLAYRQRNAQQPVRERDVSERYLLEVTDAHGRPVHDAEVAVQRAGVAEPLMWARTDTAGHVWLHPRAFMAASHRSTPQPAAQSVPGAATNLSVAVRKGGAWARATLQRGQANTVQVRLDAAAAQRPRLDLVFMVDATGSMADEIDKLKTSMRTMSKQIAALPGKPDICYGLVSYRDRGDAYLTRSHDFTNDLGAFQRLLARVEAAGGGDQPEALNEALHEVVHGLRWRSQAARMVIMVADAPPHLDYGGPQYDTDMQAALAKGIKLFAVGASGLDPIGEYVFRQLAQYTAGRFVFLTYQDAADPSSGPGTQTTHDVKNYSVQTLDQLVVRLVTEEMARLPRS